MQVSTSDDRNRGHFPVVRISELLQYHTRETLEAFATQHSRLLHRSVMIMILPPSEPSNLSQYNVLGRLKPVIPLDGRQYVFLSREDHRAIKSCPREELEHFMRRHQQNLFKIFPPQRQQLAALPPNKRKRLNSGDEEGDGMDIVPASLSPSSSEPRSEIMLAVERREREIEREQYLREMEALRERHALELRLQRAELTVEALLKHFKVGDAGTNQLSQSSFSLSAATNQRSLTKRQWLHGTLYAQNLTRLSLQNATRWFNLFHNRDLTLERLHSACFVDRVPGAPTDRPLRLIVPVTYRYSLKRIIQLLALAQGQSNASFVTQLLKDCPENYRVVLFGGQNMPEVKHRVNCTVLALHLHLVKQAIVIKRQLADARETWSVKLCDQEVGAVPHTTPSPDLLALHYPAACYSGLDTYLLPDMTMPAYYLSPVSQKNKPMQTTNSSSSSSGSTMVETSSNKAKKSPGKSRRTEVHQQASNNKGIGTGNGKRCPYCGQLSRTLIQGTNYQVMHQLINCPWIALLSQNEAVILETLRRRCLEDMAPRKHGKKNNKLAEHAFLMGSNAVSLGTGVTRDVQFGDLDSQTLLRHATEVELQSGDHIHGLRINSKRYIRTMRRDVSDTLATQLNGPLFGLVDQQVQSLLAPLIDTEDLTTTPLRLQLYDEFDQKFMAMRYDPQTKKLSPGVRNFDDATEDGLFFSLDSTQARSFATEMFAKSYQMDVMQQQLFLNGPPPAQSLLMDQSLPQYQYY